MAKKTLYLLGILLSILVGIYFYVNWCSACAAPVATPPAVVEKPAPTSFPFAYQDGSFGYDEQTNFNFKASSSDILEPVSQKVLDGVDRLKAFLAENPDKAFTITGYYTSDEANDSPYPNLGLARSHAIKNYLVAKGIPSSQINCLGELMDSMVPDGDVYLGPATYLLEGHAEDLDEQLQALYERIKNDPLVLHFETAEYTVDLTDEDRHKFADISRYLDKVEGAVCLIVGHTDSTAKDQTNMVLGQNRADFAKSYLVEHGISPDKVKTVSKGETEPIASNDTEVGRAHNRRAEVTLE